MSTETTSNTGRYSLEQLMNRPIALVESPYRASPGLTVAGARDEEARNTRYVRVCMRYAFLKLGVLPFASHALYTLDGILLDYEPFERMLGIAAGLAIGKCAERSLIFMDFGISEGMKLGIEAAARANRPCVYINLPADELKNYVFQAL
jgi:hypothetical protein